MEKYHLINEKEMRLELEKLSKEELIERILAAEEEKEDMKLEAKEEY